MPDFDKDSFNLAMSKLNGDELLDEPYPFNDVPSNYHDDLNLLMPLAWKYGIDVIDLGDGAWEAAWYHEDDEDKMIEEINKDPIEAIRNCLMSIEVINE